MTIDGTIDGMITLLTGAYLEVEVKAFAQVDLLGEALVLAHVKRQCVVAVGVLALAEEHGVVETHKLATGHPLLFIDHLHSLLSFYYYCSFV